MHSIVFYVNHRLPELQGQHLAGQPMLLEGRDILRLAGVPLLDV
jgi:hypothetical protein